MKLEYTLNNISGKKKSLCVGDLIKYYGETRYKIIESIQKLNENETTKGMVANLLKKVASNNVAVDMMIGNLEELAKKNIFSFTIDGINPVLFDTGKDTCVIVVDVGAEYFSAKAIYDMMKPGFRKRDFEENIKKEKAIWRSWFEKNLKEDYTKAFTCKILEE
jgi:hypothetical protein